MAEKKPPHPDDSMIDCEKGSPRWKPDLAPGVDEWANNLVSDINGTGKPIVDSSHQDPVIDP